MTTADLAPQREARDQSALMYTVADRFNALHETLYARGGIRPVNAAIEELSKVMLLQIKHARDPDWQPNGCGPISQVLDPDAVAARADIDDVKTAFAEAITLPEFTASLPNGNRQPIWPSDEPLRISRPDVLAEALSILDPELLRDIERAKDYDLLGTAFDTLLRGRYDHAGGLATYLTPHNVAELLATLCMHDLEVPQSWSAGQPAFGDLCCGTGRFLIAGLREGQRLAAERFGDSPEAARFADAFAGSGLVGADQSTASVAKARLNLILFGVDHPTVFAVEDSITSPVLDRWVGRMHLILTNPPFGGGKYDDPEGVQRTTGVLRRLGARSSVDPGLAFVVRCLEMLDDGGRLGIILPDGLVDGAALRSALLGTDTSLRIRDVSIEANVSLPTATFALSGTVARTSAVVLRKGGTTRHTVLLARAEHCGYVKQAGHAVPDPKGDDLPSIAALATDRWRDGQEALADGLAVLSEHPAVSLVNRIGLVTADPSRVDPTALRSRQELEALGGTPLGDHLKPVKRRTVTARGEQPFISVLHVDELGSVNWPAAQAHIPTTPGRPASSRQLLVSMLNPRKLRATVVPDETEDVLCSSEFGVFDADEPWAVLVLLNDPRVRVQLNPLGRGTSSSRRRIDNTDLFSLIVAPLDDEARRRGAFLRDAHLQMRSGTVAAAQALGR